MSATPDEGSSNTALHRNPFAILGAFLTDTRTEINSLAEDKAFVLEESVVQEARRVLTNSRARIDAEVGWLPGLEPEAIRRVFTAEGISSSVSVPSSVLAITRANIAAAWLEAQPKRHGVDHRTTDQMTILFQLDNQIHLEQTREALNAARRVAGFSEIERIDLAEAIRAQRAYFLDVCRQVLGHLDRSQLAALLVQFQKTDVCNGDLLKSLVDDYALAIDEELHELAGAINKRIQTIRRFPKSTDLDKKHLTEAIIQYGKLLRPVIVGHELIGAFHVGLGDLFNEVRSLAVDLANDHEEYDSAATITKALGVAFGEVSRFREVLASDTEALTEIISQRDALLRSRGGTPPRASAVRPSTDAHRWTDGSNMGGGSTSSASHRGMWSRIPMLFKVLAVLLVVGWVGDLVNSEGAPEISKPPTSPRKPPSDSPSYNSCEGISDWWDESVSRYDETLDLLNSSSTLSTTNDYRVRALIRNQQLSQPPSAARDFNTAMVAYMQFAYDSSVGLDGHLTQTSWDAENNRLHSAMQREQREAASECGITLVTSPSPEHVMKLLEHAETVSF